MKPLFALAVLTAFLPLAASAETEVTPGLWSYQATFALGPIPMQDNGTHCVGPDMAEASYQSLFNDINPNCEIIEDGYQADGYHFTLACTGEPEGQLKGRLAVNGDSAQLNATGWTAAQETRMPVILSASAKKVGASCS